MLDQGHEIMMQLSIKRSSYLIQTSVDIGLKSFEFRVCS